MKNTNMLRFLFMIIVATSDLLAAQLPLQISKSEQVTKKREVQLKLIAYFMEQKNYESAIKLLSELVTIDIDSKSIEQAISYLKIIAENPEFFEYANFLLGAAHERKNEYEKAVQFYMKAKITKGLNHVKILKALARLSFLGLGMPQDIESANKIRDLIIYSPRTPLREIELWDLLWSIYLQSNDRIRAHNFIAPIINYLKNSSNNKLNARARVLMAAVIMSGNTVEEHSKMLYRYLLEAIFLLPENDPTIGLAHFFLGELYYHGWGVNRDYEKAYSHYIKIYRSLKMPDFFTNLVHYRLGKLYFYGLGTEKNYVQAKIFLTLAALPRVRSISTTEGMDIEKFISDIINIEKLNIEKWADYKTVNKARLLLGIIYLSGLGTERDFKNAKSLFESIIKDSQGKSFNLNREISAAYYSLGSIYLKGDINVPQNYQKALLYLQTATQFKNKRIEAAAYVKLGRIYKNGLGLPKDLKKAEKYFELALQSPHEGTRNKAQCYLSQVQQEIAHASIYEVD